MQLFFSTIISFAPFLQAKLSEVTHGTAILASMFSPFSLHASFIVKVINPINESLIVTLFSISTKISAMVSLFDANILTSIFIFLTQTYVPEVRVRVNKPVKKKVVPLSYSTST